MGAPLHVPGMRGATVYAFQEHEGTHRGTAVVRNTAPVWEWRGGVSDPRAHGWVAVWHCPDVPPVIYYAGSHPAGVSRRLWREWFGAELDRAIWMAARRPLTINNLPPSGTVH